MRLVWMRKSSSQEKPKRCEAGGNRVGAADGDEVTKAWVPRNAEELLLAIQESDYGVSDDRSSTLASPAIAAYHNGLGESNRVTQPRGQPLREGFHIVKVRAKRPLSSAAISRHLDLSRENLAKISELQGDHPALGRSNLPDRISTISNRLESYETTT